MLNIRLSDRVLTANPRALAVAVTSGPRPAIVAGSGAVHADLRTQLAAFLTDSDHDGRPGTIAVLPRPLAMPRRVFLVGIGDGGANDWRAAGAALARAAAKDDALDVALPDGTDRDAVRGLAEGLWLASYSFNLTRRIVEPENEVESSDHGQRASHAHGRPGRPHSPEVFVDGEPDLALRKVTLLVANADDPNLDYAAALAAAYSVASATRFARDLTNMPSEEKTPAWFADQVVLNAVGRAGLHTRVWAGNELAEAGFGGVIAVGAGSTRAPRLVQLSWEPEDTRRHVVLVGKGITFDTGGISIKPREGMKLMRKDMGGAAAVIAATLGAAELDLPVRITTLAPLAENMASGSAWRPGDVVRHYGGRTSECLSTDAEGRVVLADALAYAAAELAPDVVVDLATLTGANAVALGKRTAALYSENDELAAQLCAAARSAGERAWRMPLVDDYVRDIASEVADVANSSSAGAGSIAAALFLREFTGPSRSNWVHIDMSAPSWSDAADGELAKGATGWGVRTLLRWLADQ
ncbi:MAG TPA: leucyl aminopeptidase [Micromonosporaceae bacterium]